MLRQLLGMQLKSDEVLELLRDYDLPITYSIDLLQEGTPDSYFCESKDGGFSLRFDENQTLTSVFCYTTPGPERAEIDRSLIGVPLYSSFADARIASESPDLNVRIGTGVEAIGRTISFVRLDYADHSVHYEYENGVLVMVTLMAPRDVERHRT